jgi:hypothetical protein
MTTPHPELRTSREFQGLILPAHPMSGTEDDDDDRDDEHAGEHGIARYSVRLTAADIEIQVQQRPLSATKRKDEP